MYHIVYCKFLTTMVTDLHHKFAAYQLTAPMERETHFLFPTLNTTKDLLTLSTIIRTRNGFQFLTVRYK